MRVDELRDGLRAAADREPTTDVVTARAGVSRRHRRHQAVRGTIAAVCVVVVALAGWQLGSLGGDDDRSLDVGGTPEGAAAPVLLPSPTDGLEPSGVEVRAAELGPDEGATLTAWIDPTGTSDRAVLITAVAGAVAVPTDPGSPEELAGWDAVTSTTIDDWTVTALFHGLTVEERSRIDDLTIDERGVASFPVPDDLSLLVDGQRISDVRPGSPMVVLPADGTSAVGVALVGAGDGEPTLTLWGGDPVMVDLAVLLAGPGTRPVTVRGTSGWVVAGGPFDPGNGGGPVIVWAEGGRGWALSLTSLSGSGIDDDAVAELVATAEALEQATPERWAEALARSAVVVGGRDSASSGGEVRCAEVSADPDAPAVPCEDGTTFEGQGTPIDPVTGGPLVPDADGSYPAVGEPIDPTVDPSVGPTTTVSGSVGG